MNPKLIRIGSNWTSLDLLQGRKHFRLGNFQYVDGERKVEMIAVCDRTVRILVDTNDLGNKNHWCPGWQR